MFYRYFADCELKVIVSVPILKYYLPKKANPEDWFKTRVLLNPDLQYLSMNISHLQLFCRKIKK